MEMPKSEKIDTISPAFSGCVILFSVKCLAVELIRLSNRFSISKLSLLTKPGEAEERGLRTRPHVSPNEKIMGT